MASSFAKTLQRLRVPLGFILTPVYLIFSQPNATSIAIGVAIALPGLLLRAWACGHLRKSAELDVSGPYAYMRNPLYVGTFVMAIGFGLASGVWWLVLLAAIFIVSIYLPVLNVEAEVLRSRLGDEYREYAANVPLLFTRLTPWKKSSRTFDFRLYLKNGEYNAAIGFALTTLFLIAKAYWLG